MTKADLQFELMLERRQKQMEARGSVNMNLQKMTIEELKGLQIGIADEIKIREQIRLDRAEEICQKMVELEQELKDLGFELKYNTNGYTESNYKKFAKLDKRDKKIKIFIQG